MCKGKENEADVDKESSKEIGYTVNTGGVENEIETKPDDSRKVIKEEKVLKDILQSKSNDNKSHWMH